jgi:hypothetical protein
MGSGSTIPIRFCFRAVAKLISCIGKVDEPTEQSSPNQTKEPVGFYVSENSFHDLLILKIR